MSTRKTHKRQFYNLSNKSILWLFLILLAAGFWFRTSTNAYIDTQLAAVSSAISGIPDRVDATTVDINGIQIRLEGIDAPNKRGAAAAYFEEANATMDVAAAEPWDCLDTGKRSKGRFVATCEFTSGAGDVGLWIVAAGYGVDWPEYSGGRYAAAEAEARRKRLGVWRTLDRSWIE